MNSIHRHRVATGLAILLAVIASSSALAQPHTGPENPGAGGLAGPVNTPNRVSFTHESLPEMLRQLGYAVKEKPLAGGKAGWEIVTKADGWSYTVQVTPFGKDGKIMCFDLTSNLGRKLSPQAGAQALLTLLRWNHEIGVENRIGYDPQSGCLTLKRPFNYPDASLEELAANFVAMFKDIRETYPLWSQLQTATAPSTTGGASVAGAPTAVAANTTVFPTAPSAPGPVVTGAAVKSVAGTVWSGTENLQSFGKLTFQFHAAGKSTMIDAHSTIDGTWTQTGASVTIRFKDCVYQGRITGPSMSGTAMFTSGNAQNQTWSFQVGMTKS